MAYNGLDFNYGEYGEMQVDDNGQVETLDGSREIIQRAKYWLSVQIGNFEWDPTLGMDRRAFYQNPIDSQSIEEIIRAQLAKVPGIDAIGDITISDVQQNDDGTRWLDISIGLRVQGNELELSAPIVLNEGVIGNAD